MMKIEFDLNRSMEIINELLSELAPLRDKGERFSQMYLECLYLKQGVEDKTIALPLKTIHGLFLGHVILDDMFNDYPNIHKLTNELANKIQILNVIRNK